jgi:hypothetical protein
VQYSFYAGILVYSCGHGPVGGARYLWFPYGSFSPKMLSAPLSLNGSALKPIIWSFASAPSILLATTRAREIRIIEETQKGKLIHR